jgi:ectoine hydroxylase-related dioxygenase (phytanoyl-CoA dioxygenase family)
MTAELRRIKHSAPSAQICDILERDGAVIVEDILNHELLTQLNAEMDRHVAAVAPGLRHPTMQEMIEFYGEATIRIDGLPAKSDSFIDVMLLPQLRAAADHFLLPNCKDYLFNTGQLIQIGPGESAQELHTDESAWKEVPTPKPQLQVEAMFALSDFTAANGATQVVPGSHRWDAERKARPDEVTQAEMKAGSALFYLGTAIHGGGANTTSDQFRRGMFLGYVVGWLRTEENTFLTVPLEKVRDMPTRAQELLGYKAHGAIGVVDVGSPMALLNKPARSRANLKSA